jgi:hypothetical protein
MLSQVFISYKREEIEFAELLESKLKKANFNVWIDRQLRAGTDWREKIDEKIRKSIALIVIMTRVGFCVWSRNEGDSVNIQVC